MFENFCRELSGKGRETQFHWFHMISRRFGPKWASSRQVPENLGTSVPQWQVPLSWKSSYRLLFKVHVLTYCVYEYWLRSGSFFFKFNYKNKKSGCITWHIGTQHIFSRPYPGNGGISQLNSLKIWNAPEQPNGAILFFSLHSKHSLDQSPPSTLLY